GRRTIQRVLNRGEKQRGVGGIQGSGNGDAARSQRAAGQRQVKLERAAGGRAKYVHPLRLAAAERDGVRRAAGDAGGGRAGRRHRSELRDVALGQRAREGDRERTAVDARDGDVVSDRRNRIQVLLDE